MTLRAIVLGFLGGALINGFCFFNDFVLRGTFLVGNYLPISVFGGLLLFVMIVNPLLGYMRTHFALIWRPEFTGKELAVVIALILAACYVPGRGLMHYFATFLMLPHHHERTNPSWQKEKILELAPKPMLADISQNEDAALNGFVQGLGKGDSHISFSDIPWFAWWETLGFWLPLLFTISVAFIALALIVHRQWSDHEQIAYPIATFASALLPKEGETQGSVFRNKYFWVATGIVVFFHLNNFAVKWWPEKLIEIPQRFDFTSLIYSNALWDVFRKISDGGGWMLFRPTIFFTAVGFAYFLSTDVSLSLGIGPLIYCFVIGTLKVYGINFSGGGFMTMKVETFLYGGAYFGVFLVLLYTGRHYYYSVFKHTFCIPCDEKVEQRAIMASRIFMMCCLLFVLQLVRVGLDWRLAVLYTIGTVMLFTVVSRLVAETGTFFVHAWFFPCVIIWGFLGSKAIGPQNLLIMFMVSSLLMIDPREAVMPFLVHGLKIADMNHVKLGRVAALSGVSLLLAFFVGTAATLYWQYDKGSGTVGDGWTNNAVPKFSFDSVVRVKETLRLQGNLELSEGLTGWERFGHISPNNDCVIGFFVMTGLVLLFAAGRLHFPRWPLHPAMFLVLGTWQAKNLAAPFLLGWLIKSAVTKYGGGSGYNRVKPIMIGLIAGDMLGGIIPMIVGAIYYYWTGEPPESYRVLPT
ncbi:MAG: hypothetical protein O3B01_08695 [Planctomycetota bacterium]|nr:hypothetical protein [Planctomycetota bacterium]MDA1138647.1 hypothetical protein [Planctomycetota bacterium]